MKKKTSIVDYLKYRLKSVSEHGVHSPFVFDLVTNVIYTDKDYYAYKGLERFREQLLRSDKLVDNLKISELAADALTPKYVKLLLRLANRFQPDTILEIGNSIGIETAYMASANSAAKIIKLESSKNLAVVLKENFKALKLDNIAIVTEPLEKLPVVLDRLNTLGFVFINMQSSEEVLNSFSQSLAKANENSVFVINDIAVSKEMKSVWEEIKNNDAVSVTVDLFQLGIVFFRREQVKEHFLIRF